MVSIGVVDYGAGNHASVTKALYELGYRCKLASTPDALELSDVVVLPGVGAFSPAMSMLNNSGFSDFLRRRAFLQRPILGICLGMQLFADASHEGGYTCGLGLLPGEVVPLGIPRSHIGWNNVETVRVDPLFSRIDGASYYFNHSFIYQCESEYQVCMTRHAQRFPAVVRKGNLVGLQFHPEKSQRAGRDLLRPLIEGLCHA